MDEYLGLPPGSPQSFAAWLRARFWDKVPLVQNVIDGNTPDVEGEMARYSALLASAPLDAVICGMGENGHLAFNDPPGVFAEPPGALLVKQVQLSLSCRLQQVNDGAFAALESVPTAALTVTIPALMAAARVFCVVPGPTKRAAVAATLTGTNGEAPFEDCPASALLVHPSAALYLDRPAFGHCMGPHLHYKDPPGSLPVVVGMCPATGTIRGVTRVCNVDASIIKSVMSTVVGPGFFDLQVNGFMGLDFSTLASVVRTSGTAPFSSAVRALAERGTTSFLPTFITNDRATMLDNCRALGTCLAADPFAASLCVGVHLEGPFISSADGFRGAHPLEHCTTPQDWPDFLTQAREACANPGLSMITIAPELPGAMALISAAAGREARHGGGGGGGVGGGGAG